MFLCSLAKVSHKTCTLFATLDTIVQLQCDLTITRNTCGSMLIKLSKLGFENKIG